MSWTRPADLRLQVQRLWDRGEMLRALATGESPFPRRLVLKTPTSSEMIDRFDDVRTWIAELLTVACCRVEMREFTHRMLGTNAVPQAVWIDHLDNALELLGKGREAARFQTLLDRARDEPALLTWAARKPLRALELADDWERLLAVVRWVRGHPRPGIYLRQVDIPGVNSKFIESRLGVLSELLGAVMPQSGFAGGGIARFTTRYGFRDKPVRIRLRELDANRRIIPGVSCADIELDADSFASLNVQFRQVFITENEINFLAFPPVPDSVVLFGAGYGWHAWAGARWLRLCPLIYWGDIDTHGFKILNQLRNHFPHVESLLMDRATLMAHELVWGAELNPVTHDLPNLTDAERALFDELRDNRIRPRLRLEQELVAFSWLQAALECKPQA